MTLGVILAMGARRLDSPRDLVIVAGLLIGIALAVNPISHNYYFLLLLPLVAGLLDRGLVELGSHPSNFGALLALAIFMLVDMAARFGSLGSWLRDLGLPVLSLVGIVVAGAIVLREKRIAPVVLASVPIP